MMGRITLIHQHSIEFIRSTEGETVLTASISGRNISCLVLDDARVRALQKALWKIVGDPTPSTIDFVLKDGQRVCYKLSDFPVIDDNGYTRPEWVEILSPGAKRRRKCIYLDYLESSGDYSIVLRRREVGNPGYDSKIIDLGGMCFPVFSRWEMYLSLKEWMQEYNIEIEEYSYPVSQ